MLATRVRRAASSSARRGCWAADTAGTSTVTQSACRDFCLTKAIIGYIHSYCQVRGVPLALRHPLHACRGHGVRVRRRAGGRAARADRGALRQVLLPGGAAREARGLGRQQRSRALPAPRPAR